MSDHATMSEIVKPWTTVSDRIRALDAAGYTRAAIAEFLGKRYQHVRNVLVEDERRRSATAGASAPSGVSEGPAQSWNGGGRVNPTAHTETLLRLQIAADGAIRLPADVEDRMGFKRGGVAIARLHNDRIELLSVGEALRRVREMVRDLAPSEEGMAESLIADRRREAAAEAAS